MATICINGGGFAGLSTALLLAADGHDVTVIERDPPPPSRDPEEVWESWEHRAVPQLRQTHGYLDRVRRVLSDELPHVWARLVEAGVGEHDLSAHPPTTVSADPFPIQEDDAWFAFARRSTVDCVLRHAAEDDPRVTVLSGVVGKGLLTHGHDGPGQVTGLATSAGPLDGDVVVDCGGRRTAVPTWVEDAGGRPPEETGTEMRVAYWTQWFRLRPGAEMPTLRGRPMTVVGPVAALCFPADHGWFSATIVSAAGDKRLRALSDRECLVRTLGRIDLTREWVDPEIAVPAGAPMPMTSAVDQRRRYVCDGEPCLPGLVGVGDSIGASNPSLGRGTSFAAMHAVALRDVLRADTDAATVSQRLEVRLDREYQPWWDATVTADQAQLARMRAAAEGTTIEPDPGTVFAHAAQHDPELWRAMTMVGTVRRLPSEIMSDQPELLGRVMETVERVGPPQIEHVDVEALLAE